MTQLDTPEASRHPSAPAKIREGPHDAHLTFPSDPTPPRAGARLAAFYRLRGHPSFEVGQAFFVRLGRFSYTLVPPTQPVEPDLTELDEALRRARAPFARYPTLTHPGEERGAFVCEVQGFSRSRLPSYRRGQVRRGLEVATVRQLDASELLESGMELNRDTMARHGNSDPEFGTKQGWRRFVAAAEACRPFLAIYGAFVDDRLSCYSVTCREGDTIHLLEKMIRTDDLDRCVSPAIDFWLLTEAAKDPTIRLVTNGTVRQSLVRYKTNMGFEIVPFRWASRPHPALRRFARSRWFVGASDAVKRAFPGSKPARLLGAAVESAQHA